MLATIKRWWKNAKLQCTYEDRLSWLNQVIKELDQIAESSEVRLFLPEAIERIEYFRTRYVRVLPCIDESNELVMDHFDEPKDEKLPSLLIAPLFTKDAKISSVADYIVGEEKTGRYSSGDHVIYLIIDRGETYRFMMSTLLHEVGHAIAAEREGRIFQHCLLRDKKQCLEEELTMWWFDCLLVVTLGGQELRCQMDHTAREICQMWLQGSNSALKIQSTAPLDLCYGPVESERAKDWRHAFYVVYCNLIASRMFFEPIMAHEYQLALIDHIMENTSKER